MVKPPRTMQPEHVDISRAGRRAGSAFKEDSFRNYMARKIDMQRQQFGEPSLPPPPKPLPEQSPMESMPTSPTCEESKPTRLANVHERQQTSPCSPNQPFNPPTPLKVKNPEDSRTPPSALKKSSSTPSKKRGVRFAQKGGPERKSKRRKTRKSAMPGPVIRKWHRRHGHFRKKKGKNSGRENLKRAALEEENNGREQNNGINHGGRNSAREDSQACTEESTPLHDELEQLPQKAQPAQFSPVKEKLPLNTDDGILVEEETPPLEDDPQVVDDDEELIEEPKLEAPTSPLHIQRSRPDLFFYGVTIKINGYTEPDNETLKRMIQRYGGQFECYETQRVTHIVAEHLSTAKANIFKKQKSPVPVVSPRWIVDSINQKCQLAYGKYLIEEVRDDSQQKGIQEMFGAAVKKAPGNKENEKPGESSAVIKEIDTEEAGGESEQANEENDAEVVMEKQPPSPQGKTNKMYINGNIRTTGTDPDFLENYFNNSRLSFIGSYKQRSESAGANGQKSLNKDLGSLPSYVFHVDMDCFFAAVAIRNFPQYKDKPVVISHHGKKRRTGADSVSFQAKVSKNSTSECATCNYKAREFGIKKGMFLGRAKELCPELVILNYDFEGYQEVSTQVSEILHQIAGENHGSIQEVSCDESYMEMLQENYEQAAATAERIRAQIFEATQCTASIGVGKNKFLAKLGTDRVKPNASYVVTDHRSLLETLKLRDLPGIGWRSEPKLVAEGLTTVRQVWDLGSNAASTLERILGVANGKKIYNYCHGKDDRKVEPAKRVTIGAECNYGVRFDGPYGVDHFFKCLSKEVQKRMENVGVKGCHITLKVKRRKQGAKSPPKFLGHGKCHSISRSMEIPGSRATCDAGDIYKAAMGLFKDLAIPLDDVRGMGVVISRLTDCENDSKSSLAKWLTEGNKSNRNIEDTERSPSEDDKQEKYAHPPLVGGTDSIQLADAGQDSTQGDKELHNSILASASNGERDTRDDVISTQIILPPLSQLRMSQVDELPNEMQRQIKARFQRKAGNALSGNCPFGLCESLKKDAIGASTSRNEPTDNNFRQRDVQQMGNNQATSLGDFANEYSSLARGTMNLKKIDEESTKPAGDVLVAEDGPPPPPMKQCPRFFFDEDLLPLKVFLDENHSTDVEAVQLVLQFLTICVQEGRPKDALTILRSIRHRGDEWSTYSVQRELFDGIDDEYFRKYGGRLNLEQVIEKDNHKAPPLR